MHSSLRVAMRDDDVPVSFPVWEKQEDGSFKEGLSGTGSVRVPKGSFVHVPVEGFNLDKGVWGEDAWKFKCVASVGL